MKRRENNFEVGDMVLAHLRKETFPSHAYNRKKIGPCKIIKKFSPNAYELELPKGLEISPIFDVLDLYTYHEGEPSQQQQQQEKTLPKKMK